MVNDKLNKLIKKSLQQVGMRITEFKSTEAMLQAYLPNIIKLMKEQEIEEWGSTTT